MDIFDNYRIEEVSFGARFKKSLFTFAFPSGSVKLQTCFSGGLCLSVYKN